LRILHGCFGYIVNASDRLQTLVSKMIYNVLMATLESLSLAHFELSGVILDCVSTNAMR